MNWLREAREAKGLTQRAVARAAHIAQPTYANIESGKRGTSVPVAKLIATVLGVKWTRFYEEDK